MIFKKATHTFRRGGARHRLMHGAFKWGFRDNWACWSGDSDILQRYLHHFTVLCAVTRQVFNQSA